MVTKKNSSSPTNLNQDDKLDLLVEQTAQLQASVDGLIKKFNWFFLLSQIKTIVWLTVILVSVIATVIYLPPLIKTFVDSYQNLLSGLK